MSEAELISTGFMGIETRMTLWATEFTLIFAYLAALYFVLRHKSAGLRSFTFAIFALMLAFMWIGFTGTDIGSERYLDARNHSIELGLLPEYWSVEASHQIDRLLSVASLLGHLLHGVALAGCCYVTFFYRWRKPESAAA